MVCTSLAAMLCAGQGICFEAIQARHRGLPKRTAKAFAEVTAMFTIINGDIAAPSVQELLGGSGDLVSR